MSLQPPSEIIKGHKVGEPFKITKYSQEGHDQSGYPSSNPVIVFPNAPENYAGYAFGYSGLRLGCVDFTEIIEDESTVYPFVPLSSRKFPPSSSHKQCCQNNPFYMETTKGSAIQAFEVHDMPKNIGLDLEELWPYESVLKNRRENSKASEEHLYPSITILMGPKLYILWKDNTGLPYWWGSFRRESFKKLPQSWPVGFMDICSLDIIDKRKFVECRINLAKNSFSDAVLKL